MFVPYSTDAPLYHWPVATSGIILTNVVLFFATAFRANLGLIEPAEVEWLFIQFDQVNPLQWITGSFMHFDLMHLLGNMFFLFCFGLVVEGKAGNWRFLGLYLAMCIGVGAVTQIPMYLLGGESLAGGASAAISGLMVIALLWAPENEVSFFYLIFFFWFGTFEVQIFTVSCFFIAMDVLSITFSGFAMSGAMAHVLGALMGLPIGVWLLRNGTVDCEGWDLISRHEWLKQYPILYGEKQRQRDRDQTDEIDNPVGTALALTGGDASAGSRLGMAVVRPAKPVTPPQTVSGVSKKRRKKRVRIETPEQRAQNCQAHPEFNRLAFVLRQSLQTHNLHAAQQAFLKIDGLHLGEGLGEKTLMHYATELGREKRWVDAIRPLAITIEKQDSMADDACLRLAQIQLKVLQRPDLASTTLQKIVVPEGVPPDPAKQERIAKRDEMLRQAMV